MSHSVIGFYKCFDLENIKFCDRLEILSQFKIYVM